MVAIGVLLVALLERVPRARFHEARLVRPYLGTDIGYLLLGYAALATPAAAWVAFAPEAWRSVAGATLPSWSRIPFAAQVGAALVALDLGNYLVHRALHRFSWLWRIHEVHHSSLHLDWAATFRSHILEQGLRRLTAPVLLIFLGMPTEAVASAAVMFVVWATLDHSNLRLPLGGVEGVLVTPRLHRAHHVASTMERNFGTVLTVWDRVFGTFEVAAGATDAVVGLPASCEPYPQTFLRQLGAPVLLRRTQ